MVTGPAKDLEVHHGWMHITGVLPRSVNPNQIGGNILLIITPSKFSSAMTLLETHKEQTEILTEIITLESVYSKYRQGDQAERVKRCIAEYHKRLGYQFFLVVGDADTVPVRYTKTDRGDPNAFNTAFYPTDLYVCFAKKRGLEETDMCRSEYVYHSLRRFRAGIESGISWLKRSMGLARCMWKGWHAFNSYVWSSIVAANLLTVAMAKLAPT